MGSRLDVYYLMCLKLVEKKQLFRDSLGWLVKFISKFLQFQPEVQQNFLIAGLELKNLCDEKQQS